MERIQNHRFPNGRKNLNKKTNSTARNETSSPNNGRGRWRLRNKSRLVADEDISSKTNSTARNEVSGTNNGRGRWRSRNKSKLVADDDNSLSISFLHNLTENNSSNSILKFLTKNKEKYTNIFNDSMDKKSLSVITNLNAELCQSTFISDKYNILRITMNKQFLDSWNGIISTVSLERTNVLEWRKLEKDVLNIFTIFEHSLDLFPSLCWYMIKDMLILIKVNNEIINGNSLSGSNNFKEKILYLTEQVTYFENRFSSTKKRTKTTMNKQLEPDDDFRSMDIFPSTKELVTPERNFVRKNIINGSYDNIPHYLDVLFRLQREDFLNPIREDICDYIRNVERRFFNIKVFENVTFFGETINKDDICFTVNLNMDKNTQARVKSNQNKRFMTGCLLVFTDDNFQTTFCGLVKKSDAASRGELTVSFEGTFPKLRHNYIMVECIVFFDPYYHVLKVLQTLPHDQLSMSKYIIDVETSITKPSYIPSYNSNVEANLNDSQIKAMKGALTQEFVVIQGPPGTGKTYLGLKITQRLLQYKAGPILVVCYTNHALDQFLEGLLPFTNKLVRFGSQTKSKVLQEKHTLRAMRREQRISVMVKDQRESIESYAKQIKNIDREIKRLREPNGIIDFNFVKENVSFLRDSCFSSFTEEDFFAWILQDTSKLDDTNYLKFIYRNYFSALKGKRDYFLAPTHMPQCLTYLKIGMSFVEDDILNLKAAYENGEVFQDVYLEWKRYYEDGLVTIQKDFKIFTEKLQFLKKQMNNRYEDPPSQKLITDPFILSSDQRWQLYNFWLKCLEDALQMVKRNEIALYREAYAEFDMLMEDANVATMKKMEILGMTTSCAARMHTTLQRVECPIVVVEEAAEVVESHIIATLTKHCQHLILLGDHQQLKPSTSDYVMEKQFNLGVSLFERMVKNNIQCHTLNVQHRMRPEISRLISPVIYPDLKDAVSVSKYPQVKGVTRSVYFIDHNHEETLYGDSSKFNKFEAEFLIKLANYFLKIGYTPEDITILAAYAGQVATIKKEVPKIKTKDLENVLVTCVDNFQGEESKIILLSLVRNNARGNVGFTSIENRICVALSRAKEGLYIMGNMRQLCNASSVWVEINKTLKEDNSIGDKLPLVCEIHKTVTNIKELEDFDDVPEGGCDLQCDAMLSCGHECRKKCHVQDLSHEKYKCYEKCLKQICANPLHDLCNMYCYEDCGQCCYLVSVNLPCGHDENVPCYKENKLNEVTCTFKQTIHLRCGHMVEQLCSMKADKIKCDEYCNEVLTCGHKCVQKCHYDKDPHHENYNCEELCDKENLKCSKHINKHVSTVPCSKNPNICTEKVMKFRKECSHAYANVECHKDIDDMECTKPCKKLLECTHPCLNKCGEKCGPCKKDVSVEAECGHWINVACGKVVKNINCNKQCKKVLKCGHTCPNNCGEMCSRKCKSTCNKQLECGHYCIATCGQPCACEIKRIPECLHKVLLKCDQEPLKKWCKECTSNIDRLQSSFSDLTILDDDYYDCD